MKKIGNWGKAPLLRCGRGNVAKLKQHVNDGIEVVYISKGHLRWEIENRLYCIFPESIFYTMPWERHGSVLAKEPGHFFHYAIISVKELEKRWQPHPKLNFETRKDWESVLKPLVNNERRLLPASNELKWLLPQTVAKAREKKPKNDRILPLYARLILEELRRLVDETEIRAHEQERGGTAKLFQFIEQLPGNCEEAWTLEGMARSCGLGRTQFAHLLQRETGDSPVTYLNRMRVSKAEHLLRTTKRSITEIAFACGFQSSQYFARCFRSFNQMSPRAFRDQSFQRLGQKG